MLEPVAVLEPVQFTLFSEPPQFTFAFEFDVEYPGTTYVYSVSWSCRLMIFTASFWANAGTTAEATIVKRSGAAPGVALRPWRVRFNSTPGSTLKVFRNLQLIGKSRTGLLE